MQNITNVNVELIRQPKGPNWPTVPTPPQTPTPPHTHTKGFKYQEISFQPEENA